MVKRIALLIFCFSFLFSATAYSFDEESYDVRRKVARRASMLMPERSGVAHVSYTYNHQSGIKDNPPGQDVTFHAIDAGGAYPIRIHDNFYLAFGTQYYLHHLRFHNVQNYLQRGSLNLHNLSLPMDAIFFLGENWLLNVNFSPMIASDMKQFSGHDVQFPGHVLAAWAFHENTALLFGLAVGKEFWHYYPFPLLGLVSRPYDSFFEFESILPSYVRFNFQVAEFVELFLQGEFEGFVWDVEGEGNVPDHFMKFIDTHAGAGANFKLIDGLYFEVWGGTEPYRKVEFRDRSNNEYSARLKMSFFVEGGLVLTEEILGL